MEQSDDLATLPKQCYGRSMDHIPSRVKNVGILALVLAAAYGVAQFNDGTVATEAADTSGYAEREYIPPVPTKGLEATTSPVEGIKGGRTYSAFDAARSGEGGAEFHGYGCLGEDCSGHSAGYQWAEDNGVTDPGECGGNSWSFQEGCVAYAEEHADTESDPYDATELGLF